MTIQSYQSNRPRFPENYRSRFQGSDDDYSSGSDSFYSSSSDGYRSTPNFVPQPFHYARSRAQNYPREGPDDYDDIHPPGHLRAFQLHLNESRTHQPQNSNRGQRRPPAYHPGNSSRFGSRHPGRGSRHHR